jgi:hypothetical protein
VTVRVVTSKCSAVVCVRVRACGCVCALQWRGRTSFISSYGETFASVSCSTCSSIMASVIASLASEPNWHGPTGRPRHSADRSSGLSPSRRGKGGRAGADGCSTGVRAVPHGMAVCNGSAARRMGVPV